MNELARIYTIGHSNHELSKFLALLRQHAISAVADVRSQPVSRRFPHYCREALHAWLKAQGIGYVFLGQELGGRSLDPAHYDAEGRIDYDKLAASLAFQRGIERLHQGIQKGYRIALLCAERDPLNCHRGLLIAPHLERCGIQVWHILGDGTLEPHCTTERRLLSETGDMFASQQEDLYLAYRQRAAKVGYCQKP